MRGGMGTNPLRLGLNIHRAQSIASTCVATHDVSVLYAPLQQSANRTETATAEDPCAALSTAASAHYIHLEAHEISQVPRARAVATPVPNHQSQPQMATLHNRQMVCQACFEERTCLYFFLQHVRPRPLVPLQLVPRPQIRWSHILANQMTERTVATRW